MPVPEGDNKVPAPDASPDYLLEMLLSLCRVARAADEPFLAYLIEMAAIEAARLKDMRSIQPEKDDGRH